MVDLNNNGNNINDNSEEISYNSNADDYFCKDSECGENHVGEPGDYFAELSSAPTPTPTPPLPDNEPQSLDSPASYDEHQSDKIIDSDITLPPQSEIENPQNFLPCLPEPSEPEAMVSHRSETGNKSPVDDIGSQAMDLISEVESRLDQLREFSQISSETLTRLRIQQLEIANTQVRLQHSQEEVKQLKDEIERYDYERALHDKQCETADNQIKALSEQIRDYHIQAVLGQKLLEQNDEVFISRDYERMLHDMQCELADNKITELYEQAQQSQHYLAERNIVCAEMEQLKQSLQEQQETFDYERALHDKQCESAANTINELRTQMEQTHKQISEITDKTDAAETENISALNQRITELNEQLEAREVLINELKTQALSAREPLEDTKIIIDKSDITDRDQAINIMTNHIKSLKLELEKQRSAYQQYKEKVEAENHQTACLNDIKANNDSTFTELRRQRLAKQRKLLKSKNKEFVWLQKQEAVSREKMADLRSEKQMLSEVKNTLIEAERKMIRKWAHGRALMLMFWFVFIVVILAGSSYFGAMKLWPGIYTATSSVKAVNRPGYDMTAKQIEEWQSTHEQMAYADVVANSVSERLRQRGYTDLADPTKFSEFLKSHLSVTSEEPGTINFYLSAAGSADAQRILETYTIAFVSLSRAEAHKRADGGMTKLVVPAYVDPVPVDEHKRLQYAGITFGGSLFVVMALGALLYRRLRKAEGILETISNDDLFEPMSGWTGQATLD